MLVGRNILTQRLAAISDRLARIDSVLPPTVDAFLVDRTAQEVVAFNLFLAFQDALDVCAHVIADRGWELPQTAREHFDIMARHGILIPGLARAMGGCAGLRNLIAHAWICSACSASFRAAVTPSERSPLLSQHATTSDRCDGSRSAARCPFEGGEHGLDQRQRERRFEPGSQRSTATATGRSARAMVAVRIAPSTSNAEGQRVMHGCAFFPVHNHEIAKRYAGSLGGIT